MKQSQAEIKAIQEKLQAIQANRHVGRTASRPTASPPTALRSPTSSTAPSSTAPSPTMPLPMVEMTPHRSAKMAPRPQALNSQALDSQALGERHEQLVAAVAQLQQQSATYFKQVKSSRKVQPASQTSFQETPQSLTQAKTQALKQLEVQAQRINELSSAQEAALLEWKAIAEKLERDRKMTDREDDSDVPNICEYLTTAVPHVERDVDGSFVLTVRSVDLFRAERDASVMAQNLRHRSIQPGVGDRAQAGSCAQERVFQSQNSHSSNLHSSNIEAWGRVLWQPISTLIDVVQRAKATPTLKTSRSRPKTSAQAIAVPDFSLQDVAMWVLGSVVVRVALDLFLIANPGLWILVIGLIAAPAAIAIYRTTVAPQLGLVWGCRLFLMMVGLLLGGRL